MSGRDAFSSTVDAQALVEPAGEHPTLTILGPGGAQVRPTPLEGALSVGRHVDNDVQVEDPEVSRQHARLTFTAGQASVEDLGGANGTLVGGARLPSGGRAPLAPGVAVQVGSTVLLWAARPRPAAPASALVRARVMLELYEQVDRVARGRLSVLVLGETGAGKEVLARAVHRRSPRAQGPWLALNCGALAESLLESELFGYVKGAFTGADQDKPGLLEAAAGGTLFLDEVGELPNRVQVKLLRVLEQQEVTRLGALSPRPLDVRFVAATNRDLEAEAQAGRFRLDLYYRLAGVSLVVPPLRDRPEEIEPFAERFALEAAQESGLPAPRLTPAARARLSGHRWPGNLRELKNAMTRAVLLSRDGLIGEDLLPAAAPSGPSPSPAPEDPERARIVAALEAHAGNQTRAAAALGISRQTLSKKLDRHRIPRPRK